MCSAVAGARDHPAGLRRNGRDDHQRPCRATTYICSLRYCRHVSVSDFVRWTKGRSSHKIQQEFEHIRKRYWGQRFWQRGYFSTTAGNITDDLILRCLDPHTHKHGFSPPHDPTGVSLVVVQGQILVTSLATHHRAERESHGRYLVERVEAGTCGTNLIVRRVRVGFGISALCMERTVADT